MKKTLSLQISNLQSKHRVSLAALRRFTGFVLGAKAAEVSLIFTNNSASRKYNREFLNHDYPTDVISFNLSEKSGPLVCELYISAEFAADKAKELGIAYQEELFRYVAHGILHCLGYDDKKEGDRKKMWRKQEALLTRWFSNKGGKP